MEPHDREEEAWDAVTARWHDDEAHKAYLAAHATLDGLSEAGRRYRAALDRDPADAVALRWRDEVVRRATVIALAQLPRTAPARTSPRLRRFLAGLAVTLLTMALSWLMMRCGAQRPGALP